MVSVSVAMSASQVSLISSVLLPPKAEEPEIVMILVGVVWGLGVGFAIVAVGISLGEIANYL